MQALYLFQVLYTVQRTRADWALSVKKSSAITYFTSSEIWKRHAALLGIHAGSPQSEDFIVFHCQSEDRFIFILLETKHPVHIMVFGWLQAMVTSFLYLSSHMASYSTWRPTSIFKECSTALYQEGCCWKTLHLATGHCAMLQNVISALWLQRKHIPAMG